MERIVVFGAGGRVGRSVLDEALARGYAVTAVVRDPARHPEIARPGVHVEAGDVLLADDVARLAHGHDAAVSAVFDGDAALDRFYSRVAESLIRGLGEAGVGRLVVVGLAPLLETEPGVRVMDAPEFPAAYLPLANGHAEGLETLRAKGDGLDWLMLTPAADFDHSGVRTGGHAIAGRQARTDPSGQVSHPDFAAAILEELRNPTRHRELASVVSTRSGQ